MYNHRKLIQKGILCMKNKRLITLILAGTLTSSMILPTIQANATTLDRKNNTLTSFKKINNTNFKKENIQFVSNSDNYVEYTYSSNGKKFLAKEFISTNPQNIYSITSEYYEILNNGSRQLLNTTNTIINKKNNLLTITNKNSSGNILDINNYNLKSEQKEIKSLLGLTGDARNTRAKKQYGVYTYRRTDYGYKSIRLYKYSVAALATVLASMVSGGAASFMTASAVLCGGCYDEIWTKSLVYYKYQSMGRNRTKFVTSFYSDSSRTHQVGPSVTTIKKGFR